MEMASSVTICSKMSPLLSIVMPARTHRRMKAMARSSFTFALAATHHFLPEKISSSTTQFLTRLAQSAGL